MRYRGLTAIALAAVVVSGCSSSTSGGSSSTSPPDGWIADTHSQLVDGVSMPAGSIVQRSGDTEAWYSPDDVSTAIDRLQQQLPINQPLHGIPWCTSEHNAKQGTMTWTWADNTQWIQAAVMHYHPPKVFGDRQFGSEVIFTGEKSDEGC